MESLKKLAKELKAGIKITEEMKQQILNNILLAEKYLSEEKKDHENQRQVLIDNIKTKEEKLSLYKNEVETLNKKISELDILQPLSSENLPEIDYDVVINIDSMKSLKDGYKIEVKNPKAFMECKTIPCIVIGVIGNFNKGKSFILRKLTKFIINHGYSNTTKGISIKYSKEKHKPFAVLDSAGFETPLRIYDKKLSDFKLKDRNNNSFLKPVAPKHRYSTLTSNVEQNLENQIVNFEFSEISSNLICNTQTKIPKDIKECNYEELSKQAKNKLENEQKNLKDTIKLNETSQLENFKDDIENQKYQLFITELARDRSHMELLLQKYIIENSNILLIVLSNLTYSDQKLINRLKLISKDKKIFIIHNLKDFTLIQQVHVYIEETLLECFDLIENVFPKDTVDNLNSIYYKENNNNRFHENNNEKRCDISHFIYAREGSEAGDYYNSATESFLLKTIETNTNQTVFDPVDLFRKILYKSAKDSFEEINNKLILEKEEDIIEEELIDEENPQAVLKLLKLSEPKDIVLKKCYVDEQGFSTFFGSNFTPNFSLDLLRIGVEERLYLLLQLDIPDLAMDEHGQRIFDIDIQDKVDTGGYIFRVIGEKKNDTGSKHIKNFNTTRQSGKFSFQCQIDTCEIRLLEYEDDSDLTKYEDGVLKIYFRLVDKEKPKTRKLRKI